MIVDYVRTHLVPAVILAAVIVALLYLFDMSNVSFDRSAATRIDKEVIIRKQ